MGGTKYKRVFDERAYKSRYISLYMMVFFIFIFICLGLTSMPHVMIDIVFLACKRFLTNVAFEWCFTGVPEMSRQR